MACVVRNHPQLGVSTAEVQAAQARVQLARLVVPGSPQLAVTAGPRLAEQTEFSWSVALSQEIEPGTPRTARLRAAQGEVDAARWQSQSARRDLAIAALAVWYEAVAARELVGLAQGFADVTQANAQAARARATATLAPAVDADIAEFAAVAARQALFAAHERQAVAGTALAALLGVADPHPAGDLAPLAEPVSATTEPPAIAALRARVLARQAQAEALQRQRTPNLTIGLFAQRGAANETTLGVSVGAALPVARRLDGELAELAADIARDQAQLATALRQLDGDRAAARKTFQWRQQAAQAFTATNRTLAQQRLSALANQVAAGQLSVRDALAAQQALVGYLQAAVRAQAELCQASVQLAATHDPRFAQEAP